MGKEDVKAFEKKVKAQFSLVPFEDVTPVVEEVNLEEGDTKEAKKNGNDSEKNGKGGEETEEAENWGTVHDPPITDDMEDDASTTDLDKTEPFKEEEKGNEEKEKQNLKLKEKM